MSFSNDWLPGTHPRKRRRHARIILKSQGTDRVACNDERAQSTARAGKPGELHLVTVVDLQIRKYSV